MDKCIICGKNTVLWMNSFDADDCGCYENGLIHKYLCLSCGADYCIYVPDTIEELNKDEQKI